MHGLSLKVQRTCGSRSTSSHHHRQVNLASLARVRYRIPLQHDSLARTGCDCLLHGRKAAFVHCALTLPAHFTFSVSACLHLPLAAKGGEDCIWDEVRCVGVPETLAAPGERWKTCPGFSPSVTHLPGKLAFQYRLFQRGRDRLAMGLSKNMEAPRKHTCAHHDHVEKQVLSNVKGRARVWRGQWIGR